MKRPWLALLVGIIFLGMQVVVGFSTASLAASGDESLATATADIAMEDATVPSSSLDSSAASEPELQTESSAVSPVLGEALFVPSTLPLTPANPATVVTTQFVPTGVILRMV